MDLDLLWERVFSEDEASVQQVWRELSEEERVPVRQLLLKIVDDPERIEAQRRAARFALGVVDLDDLPPGALAFARQLAHETGRQLMAASGRVSRDAVMKIDGTLVTASDIEADQRLGEAILARYPDHGVLSEEADKVFKGQEWCWVIDPIDGTTNFSWSFPVWGVLVALLHRGLPVLGVAEFPPLGQQYYAARGQGAWCETANGNASVPIHTAADKAFTRTQLFAVGTRSLKAGKPKIPCKLRLPGSSGFDFALLACGACVGAYDSTVHVWDIAALWPLVEEAGGKLVTNHPGGIFPLQPGVDYGSVGFSALGAATPELLAEALDRFSDRFSLP